MGLRGFFLLTSKPFVSDSQVSACEFGIQGAIMEFMHKGKIHHGEPKSDGWGHALESTTFRGDLKELKGYLDGVDKHEQVMQKIEENLTENSTNQSNNQ